VKTTKYRQWDSLPQQIRDEVAKRWAEPLHSDTITVEEYSEGEQGEENTHYVIRRTLKVTGTEVQITVRIPYQPK